MSDEVHSTDKTRIALRDIRNNRDLNNIQMRDAAIRVIEGDVRFENTAYVASLKAAKIGKWSNRGAISRLIKAAMTKIEKAERQRTTRQTYHKKRRAREQAMRRTELRSKYNGET